MSGRLISASDSMLLPFPPRGEKSGMRGSLISASRSTLLPLLPCGEKAGKRGRGIQPCVEFPAMAVSRFFGSANTTVSGCPPSCSTESAPQSLS